MNCYYFDYLFVSEVQVLWEILFLCDMLVKLPSFDKGHNSTRNNIIICCLQTISVADDRMHYRKNKDKHINFKAKVYKIKQVGIALLHSNLYVKQNI